MAKITSNTQIDTINILTEVNSANDTDLILLQRGLVSHKMKKQNLIIPISQIAPIGNNTVLGNVSGSSAAPSEVTVLDSNDASSNLDTALVTEKRIKDYIDNGTTGNLSENGWTKLPNGLIMQWGTLTPSSIETLVTLPTPFPTQCLNVTASLGEYFTDTRYDDNSLIIGGYPGNNATEIYILCNLHGGNSHFYRKIFWQAIGY